MSTNFVPYEGDHKYERSLKVLTWADNHAVKETQSVDIHEVLKSLQGVMARL